MKIEWDQVPTDYKSQLSNGRTIHDPSVSNKNYNWHETVDFNGIRRLLIRSFQVIWLITNFSYLSFCIAHDQQVKIESILLSWILPIPTAKRYNCQILTVGSSETNISDYLIRLQHSIKFFSPKSTLLALLAFEQLTFNFIITLNMPNTRAKRRSVWIVWTYLYLYYY